MTAKTSEAAPHDRQPSYGDCRARGHRRRTAPLLRPAGHHQRADRRKDGSILDGRNRYRACDQANVVPKYETYDGDDNLAFVLSANLHRRQLTISQRQMIAAHMVTMEWGGSRESDQDADSRLDDARRKPKRPETPDGPNLEGSLIPMPCPWCRRLVEPVMQGGRTKEFCCKKHKNSYNAALNRLSLAYARTIRTPGSLQMWAAGRVDLTESDLDGLPRTPPTVVQRLLSLERAPGQQQQVQLRRSD